MNNAKKSILTILSGNHLYKSFLGKRTDDVGWRIFKKEYQLGHTLSSDEKRAIKQRWRMVRSPLSWGYNFFEMAKTIHGFDESFLPSSYYMPHIFEGLNPISEISLLANKSLQNLFFKDIRQPQTIAACIAGGNLFDSDYNIISMRALKDRLCKTNFIIKPARDSSMGRGVKLVKSSDSFDLDNIIKPYGYNFIIQEVIRQSDFTRSLNPTSLNCMRLTSVNLNGRTTVENRVIKIGAKGQIVDNIGSGSGGMMIGLDESGRLKDFGFRVDGTKVNAKHDGKLFGGLIVPDFSKIEDFAIKCHAMIPSMGIVGWDIALDSDNNPILVEANSYWPGITMEQIASGPIFGQRTEEICKLLNY